MSVSLRKVALALCRCEEKHSVSGHVDGHSLSFSNRLPVRGSQRQCCLQRCQESGEEARLLPRQPIHVCRSTPLSFQPFCSPLLPVLGSPGPRSHCVHGLSPCSQYRGPGLIHGWGTKISYVSTKSQSHSYGVHALQQRSSKRKKKNPIIIVSL